MILSLRIVRLLFLFVNIEKDVGCHSRFFLSPVHKPSLEMRGINCVLHELERASLLLCL